MKLFAIFHPLSLVALLLLPGCCCYYIDWVEETFKPSDEACISVECLQDEVVRTVPIRSDALVCIGLMTKEIARVMWNNDDAAITYERLKGDCSGERSEIVEDRIKKQKEKNRETATFFVSLYSNNREWSFTICKNGHAYKAAEVKQVDLDQTYQVIFGPEAFRYKQHIYEVSFDIALTPPFEFIFCNGIYKESACWN